MKLTLHCSAIEVIPPYYVLIDNWMPNNEQCIDTIIDTLECKRVLSEAPWTVLQVKEEQRHACLGIVYQYAMDILTMPLESIVNDYVITEPDASLPLIRGKQDYTGYVIKVK